MLKQRESSCRWDEQGLGPFPFTCSSTSLQAARVFFSVEVWRENECVCVYMCVCVCVCVCERERERERERGNTEVGRKWRRQRETGGGREKEGERVGDTEGGRKWRKQREGRTEGEKMEEIRPGDR